MSNVIINESAKEILKGKVFEGKEYLNTTRETSINGSAYMKVSMSDTIISENIKKDINILGVEGNYDGEPIPPVEKQYIYYKGEDGLDFELHQQIGGDDPLIEEGTNLTVGGLYYVYKEGDYDLYINGNFIDSFNTDIYFTLTEDMSVNNKVVIETFYR